MPIYETRDTARLKRGTNGVISFWRDRKFYYHHLWITEIEQPHQMTGTRVQGHHTAHWYPRSYAPGNYQITINCRNDRDQQRLANLVRLHHKTMLETPGIRFSSRVGSTGNRHLLFLRIDSENIKVRGWIPAFQITKRGVHHVAPQVTFDFFPAIDPYSSDPIISHQIREWWNPKKMRPVKDPFVVDPEQGQPRRNQKTEPFPGTPGESRPG
jgi:hypothetical protein